MFLSLWLAALSSALESNDISEHMDTIECICDLTQYSCDPYCCCDDDCKASVIQSWKDLGFCEAEKFTAYNLVFCQKKGNFFKENSEKDTLDPLFKLLCVQYNNAPDWGRYNKLIDNDNTYSLDAIQSLKDNVNKYADTLSYKYSSSSSSALYPGASLRGKISSWGLFDGTWVLSTPGANGECQFITPVKWLYSVDTGTCTVIGDLSTVCTTKMSTKLFTNLKVFNATVSGGSSEGVSISVVKRIKRTSEGETSVSTVDSTSYSGGVCKNAVVQADYRVFTTSSQVDIDRIELDLYVQDLSSSSYPTQSSSVKFFTSENAKVLSGHPGYIIGRPLLTASVTTGSTVLNSNFTVYGTNSKGECDDSFNPFSSTINYGQDTIISCSLSLTSSELKSFCESDSINDLLIFKNQKITHVANYGNITEWVSDDFVQINSTSAPTSTYSDNSCTIPSLLVYDLIYTQVGPFANPQDKIIKVNKYYKTTTWKSRSSKLSPETYLVGVTFNYINYDSDFDPYKKDKYESSQVVPDDVVYSVRSSSPHVFLFSFILLNSF